jgi:hypothetical protein
VRGVEEKTFCNRYKFRSSKKAPVRTLTRAFLAAIGSQITNWAGASSRRVAVIIGLLIIALGLLLIVTL